ncbi:MAG: hypothetical protein N3G80_03035 [Candidatus Micrarchaeota archaeon]|nr:hypothetical protein [Candidatus Micrarchaeota archaeon]
MPSQLHLLSSWKLQQQLAAQKHFASDASLSALVDDCSASGKPVLDLLVAAIKVSICKS